MKGNREPKGVEWMRYIASLGGAKRSKGVYRTMTPAERSWRATVASRKSHGYPPWPDSDRECYQRAWQAGWQAGFETAAGRK